jgi:hypothetical protein
MAPHNVFYYSSPLHKDHFVLSFAFCFDREDEIYHFALTQPYSLSRHEMYVKNLLAKNLDYVDVDVMAHTVQGRPLHLITVTDAKNMLKSRDTLQESLFQASDGPIANEPDVNDPEYGAGESLPKLTFAEDCDPPRSPRVGRVPVVFVLSRSHASETATSFVTQGLVDFLTSSHSVAKELRSSVVFKIAPVMNPDGVFLGNTRCSLLGQDLNRHWHDADPKLHPTVFAMRDHILKTTDLDMILDLHSHTSFHGLFVYGNSYDDVYRFERHIVFPKILSQNCPDFNQENSIYNRSAEKEGSCRRFFCSAASPEVNSYTIEVSILGYKDEATDVLVSYTDEHYSKIGRNIARAMWDYYKIMGFISLNGDDADSVEMSGNAVCMSRPKSACSVRSFNLLRLKEVAHQRQSAARSFDVEERSDTNWRTTTDDEQAEAKVRKRCTATRRLRSRRARNLQRRRKRSVDEHLAGSPIETFVHLGAARRHERVSQWPLATAEEGITALRPIVMPAPRIGAAPMVQTTAGHLMDEGAGGDDEAGQGRGGLRRSWNEGYETESDSQLHELLLQKLEMQNPSTSSSCSLHCKSVMIPSESPLGIRVSLTPVKSRAAVKPEIAPAVNKNVERGGELSKKVTMELVRSLGSCEIMLTVPSWPSSPNAVRKIGGGAVISGHNAPRPQGLGLWLQPEVDVTCKGKTLRMANRRQLKGPDSTKK